MENNIQNRYVKSNPQAAKVTVTNGRQEKKIACWEGEKSQ
jgi:hypothetical protein